MGREQVMKDTRRVKKIPAGATPAGMQAIRILGDYPINFLSSMNSSSGIPNQFSGWGNTLPITSSW